MSGSIRGAEKARPDEALERGLPRPLEKREKLGEGKNCMEEKQNDKNFLPIVRR